MNTKHQKNSKSDRLTLVQKESQKKSSRKSTPSSAREKKETPKLQHPLHHVKSKSEENIEEPKTKQGNKKVTDEQLSKTRQEKQKVASNQAENKLIPEKSPKNKPNFRNTIASNPSPIREVTEDSYREDQEINSMKAIEEEKKLFKPEKIVGNRQVINQRNNTDNEERKSHQVVSTGASQGSQLRPPRLSEQGSRNSVTFERGGSTIQPIAVPVQPPLIHESGGPQIRVEVQSAIGHSPLLTGRAPTSLTEVNDCKPSSFGQIQNIEALSMISKPVPKQINVAKKDKEKKKRKRISRKV